MLHDPGAGATPPSWRQINLAAVAKNGDHLSQQLSVAERGVRARKRIAASDEGIDPLTDQPVGHKSMVAIAQNNTAGEQFRDASPANGEHVSRPDGGQHTGPVDLQSHLSKAANDLYGQVVPGRVIKLSGEFGWNISHHAEPPVR
jgi:hypothetical protein